MKRQLFSLCLTILLGATCLAQTAWTPQTVPNPLKESQSFIADPDHFLTPEEIAAFNQIAYQLDDSVNVQLCVVVLNSISDNYDEFDFGTELFNTWKVGRDNRGLMLFLVMDTHWWFVHTGYGLEDIMTDALSKRLGEKYLVPKFQEGKFGEGILDLSAQIKEIFFADDVREAAQLAAAIDWAPFRTFIYIAWILMALIGIAILFIEKPKRKNFSGPYDVTLVDVQYAKITPNKVSYRPTLYDRRYEIFAFVSLLSIIIPIAIWTEIVSENPIINLLISTYVYLNIVAIAVQCRISIDAANKSKSSIERYMRLTQGNEYLTARIIVQPLIFIPYLFIYKAKAEKLKDEYCACPYCGETAHKANESVAQQHLTSVMLNEQNLQSVDYRYLECPNGHHIEVKYPGARAKQFKLCQHCGAMALVNKGSHVTKQPTAFATGLSEEVSVCQCCHQKYVTTSVLPKLIAAASTLGSGSGSFGGGFSGGSFGGGHSFGGGFTGGGGAGGRW